MYYLWTLAGGDCAQTLWRSGKLRTRARAVQRLAAFVRVDTGQEYGRLAEHEAALFDGEVVPLSLAQLRTRLGSLPADAFYPLCFGGEAKTVGCELKRRYFRERSE